MNEKTVYALGFFDGVHLGHGALLRACASLAAGMGCRAGVVTFENHPDGLVRGAAPGLISTCADRELLLRREFSMDRVVSLPFDREMMNTPWQDFFHMLTEEYRAAGFVCGEDFRFGHMGRGNGDRLILACREAGLPCIVVPQRKLDGIAISSTHIRRLIEDGEMARAVEFLGHPYLLSGKVVPGHQLGRTIGIPTANLLLPRELTVPKFGVYACRCCVDGISYGAVTNIGTRPTVDGTGITVETWILDYQGDLYNRELRLELLDFLRPERRFSDLEELRRAVLADAAKTREILKSN